ncbi:hypothetical protein [Paucibacter soli]|uniref:hypothetical protein n=1 Tax=Paucibacter soli TaxID=3133433 RepID=UPI0030A14DF4
MTTELGKAMQRLPAHSQDDTYAKLCQALLDELERRHGPVLGGSDLASALGHRSAASLRQARRRGQVVVPLFTMPNRRGQFALTREVAQWLARARLGLHDERSEQKGGQP